MIEAADLPPAARHLAIDAFHRLAVAEGAVHGCPPDEVHFHEVGALDSIVDMVGACLALDRLGVAAVRVDPLPLGRGTVRCAHGVYPVPAPATAELMRGLPTSGDDAEGEQVTPTGAALLRSWMALGEAPAAGRLEAVGQGFGHRRYADRPNVLRALLFESGDAPAEAQDGLQLETLIDDCSPELIGGLCRRLREAGALDAWCLPAQTKRDRPGVALFVLCRPEFREQALDLLFRESTTLGVREHLVRRTTLPRAVRAVSTPWGDVRVKVASWRDAPVTMAPEWSDCEACARARGVAVRAVFEAAQQAARAGQWTDDPRQ